MSGFLDDVAVQPTILTTPQGRVFASLLFAIQRGRTAEAERQNAETSRAMRELLFGEDESEAEKFLGKPGLEPDLLSLRIQVANFALFWDLKFCLVKSASQAQFVLSDHPAMLLNKFWAERHANVSIGMTSAGVILLMPISPHMAIMAYDGGVYTAPEKRSNTVLASASDVAKINVAQCVSAEQTAYFEAEAPGKWIAQALPEIAERRATPKWALTELIEVAPGVYREGEREEALQRPDGTSSTLLVNSQLKPDVDLRWSFLKHREKPRYFDDGSAAGAIRDPAWSDIVIAHAELVMRGASWTDLAAFAQKHPRFPEVGLWKRAYFG